ncbi:MAG TPA: hypothetical protein VFE63_01275 [Roseiarcus sp.]|jgi:hypothetical protein|nr:hypothetical protein [Roseiarcus sp.]
MMLRLTSAGLLILAVALGTGALERHRIWPRSKAAASREAVKPAAPLPPVRPDAGAGPSAAAAPTAVAAAPSVAPPPAAVPVPPASPPTPTRMTLAQEAKFDAWMVKTYLGCWKPAAQPVDADLYVAQVRLAFNPDGSLKKPPKLVNPPSDPAAKPQAKSVMQAVRACNPLSVPAQYRPFYEQWKTKTIHFNPQVAAR